MCIFIYIKLGTIRGRIIGVRNNVLKMGLYDDSTFHIWCYYHLKYFINQINAKVPIKKNLYSYKFTAPLLSHQSTPHSFPKSHAPPQANCPLHHRTIQGSDPTNSRNIYFTFIQRLCWSKFQQFVIKNFFWISTNTVKNYFL